MMLYENRNIFMLRVLGYVVYTIIVDYICLDYLSVFQYKLSKHYSNSVKNSMICMGWVYLKN